LNKVRDVKGLGPNPEIIKVMAGLLWYKDDIENGEPVKRNHKRYLDKEKVELLNNHIFPSMANLIFFFVSVSRYPKLKEIFENDIKDLLGVRLENPHENNPQENSYGFAFTELIRTILIPGYGFISEVNVCRKDFRLRLNHILQDTVKSMVDLALIDMKDTSTHRIIMNDFERTMAWTKMLADCVDEVEVKKPHRRIYTALLREDEVV
jgi:hypothetical protein